MKDELDTSNKYSWQAVRSGDIRDLNDFAYLMSLAKNEQPEVFVEDGSRKGQFILHEVLEPKEGAMILRQNGRAIGCIRYENFGEGITTLFISFVYVLPEKRNARIVRDILKTIRSIAHEHSADSIAWISTNATEHMYDKINMNAQSSLRRELAWSRIKKQDPKGPMPDYVIYAQELDEKNILSLFHQPNQGTVVGYNDSNA